MALLSTIQDKIKASWPAIVLASIFFIWIVFGATVSKLVKLFKTVHRIRVATRNVPGPIQEAKGAAARWAGGVSGEEEHQTVE
jgi:hypothetical protein